MLGNRSKRRLSGLSVFSSPLHIDRLLTATTYYRPTTVVVADGLAARHHARSED